MLEYFCSDSEAIFGRYTDGLYVLPALFFCVVPNFGVAWACEDSVEGCVLFESRASGAWLRCIIALLIVHSALRVE